MPGKATFFSFRQKTRLVLTAGPYAAIKPFLSHAPFQAA
jgi:hypothetical protein